MKKITILSLVVLLFAALTSCEKDETKTYLSKAPKVPVLATPENNLTIVLTKESQDQAFPAFKWSLADYGYDASVQYLVQFSKYPDMKRAKVLSSVEFKDNLTITNLAFDQFLIGSLKLTANVTTPIYFRIVAAVSGLPSSTYPAGGAATEIRTMTVTPFDTPVDVKSWGIVGNATPNGWNGPDFAMEDGDSENTFEAIVDLTVGEMKFRFGNNWDLNLGGTPASLTQGGDNIKITEAGKYKFVLTIKKSGTTYTGTYTMTKL